MDRMDLMMLALLLNRLGGEVTFPAAEIQNLREMVGLQVESSVGEDGSISLRLGVGMEDEYGHTLN